MDNLKPCPFCGGKAEIGMDNYGKIIVWCVPCQMQLGVELQNGEEFTDGWRATFSDVEEATEAWNRRDNNG